MRQTDPKNSGSVYDALNPVSDITKDERIGVCHPRLHEKKTRVGRRYCTWNAEDSELKLCSQAERKNAA